MRMPAQPPIPSDALNMPLLLRALHLFRRTSPGTSCASHAGSRQSPASGIAWRNTHDAISPPDLEGNTKPDPPLWARASSSTSAAPPARGTRCSRPAFIRSPGIVHKRVSRLISSHRTPRTSPERTAVSVANSAARRTVGYAFDRRNFVNRVCDVAMWQGSQMFAAGALFR